MNRLGTRLVAAILVVTLVSLAAVPAAITIADRAALASMPANFRMRVETLTPAPFLARWRAELRRPALRTTIVVDDPAGLRAELERLLTFLGDSRDARRDAIAIAVLVSLAVGVGVAVWVARGVARPIAAVSAATSELAAGRFAVRVRLPGHAGLPDETRALSDGFNAMAEAIERYEGERKAMLADVAHELRTPLAAVQMRLEALADGLVPFDASEVERLQGHTALLGRLVDDLRFLSLADAGRLTLDPVPFGLGPWLSGVADAAEVGLERRGVRLDVTVPSAPVEVTGDPQRLAQVLHNLLDNAARFAPAGSAVDLIAETDAVGGAVRLRVRDRGPGIPEDQLGTVFERFVQGRRRDAGGTGLGLAIVRTLVGMHGGTVSVRNVDARAGGGAEFTVTLPRRGVGASR